MANLEVSLDRLTSDTILRAAALRLDRAAKTTIYRAWANYLEGEIVSAFAAERAPNGQAWVALKPATERRKRNRKTSPRSKNKILQDTGTLVASSG